MSESAENSGERVWGSDLECLIASYKYGRVVEVWYPNLDTGAIRCCEHRAPEAFLREGSEPIRQKDSAGLATGREEGDVPGCHFF